MAPDYRALQDALDELEASDPEVKAAGDNLRDTTNYLTGRHSRLGIKLVSIRRQRLARMRWRTKLDLSNRDL